MSKTVSPERPSSECFRIFSRAWVSLDGRPHPRTQAVLQNVFCIRSQPKVKQVAYWQAIYRTHLLTPVRGSNESQREEVIPLYLARGHSGPESHGRIRGQRGAERHTLPTDDIWKRQSPPWAFQLLPKTKCETQPVQDDWITQNETEAICEPHVSCWVPGRAPFVDDRVLIPFGVWSSLKDELIVFIQHCK